MRTFFNSFPELSQHIDDLAKSIDLATIPSKAEEWHRLLDQASGAIFGVLALARKIDVIPEEERSMLLVLNSMLRDSNGKRYVDSLWDGRYTPMDVDKLDFVNSSRIAYADQLGVSEQAVIRFEKMKAKNTGRLSVSVPCNHKNCQMTKGIAFDNPATMLAAERQSSTEIWYCRHHRETAFLNEGALADEQVSILQQIANTPGITLKAAGGKREDVEFLELIGLISPGRIAHGQRLLCYSLSVTDKGRAFLDKLTQPPIPQGRQTR